MDIKLVKRFAMITSLLASTALLGGCFLEGDDGEAGQAGPPGPEGPPGSEGPPGEPGEGGAVRALPTLQGHNPDDPEPSFHDVDQDRILPYDVQAAFNGTTFFWKLSYRGPEQIRHDYLRYTNGAWQNEGGDRRDAQSTIDNDPQQGATNVNSTIYEQRTSIMINDPNGATNVEGFGEHGCFLACHNPLRHMPEWSDEDGEDTKFIPLAESGSASGTPVLDLWHWRAARSNPIGMSDDQNILTKDFVSTSDDDGGRVGDAGAGVFATQNIVDGKPQFLFDPDTTSGKFAFKWDDFWTTPYHYMTKPDAEQIGPLAPNPVNLAIADAELQGYQPQEGDTVPRRILQAGDGSHADITAHGTEFNPDAADSSIGVWNVQLQRALDTGNADDIALVPGQVYEAGFEVHLWEYTTRDHYVSLPVTIGLGVEADIQAVDLTGTVDGGAESAAAINWDEIPKQRLYLFQPGITSWEFLTGENMTEGKQYLNVQAQLVDQTHGGSDAVNNGDACASCHTVREGDEGPATNFGAMETLAGQRGGIWENTPVVTVSGGNIAPTANAGADQAIVTGSVVTLDGSGSSDPDSDPLTYAWTLVAPAGSSAVLSDATIVNPTFTADVDGTYTATLVVNDGTDDSAPNDVVVTASPDEPVGVIADGQAKYDAACAACHAAGSHDTTTAAGGNDLVADNSVIISDLASIDGSMASVSPLTAQEVLDLQAFLDSL